MNKKLINSIFLSSILAVSVVSCGQSKEQQQAELRKEDSLADIQSEEALNRANELLNSDTITVDSTKRTK